MRGLPFEAIRDAIWSAALARDDSPVNVPRLSAHGLFTLATLYDRPTTRHPNELVEHGTRQQARELTLHQIEQSLLTGRDNKLPFRRRGGDNASNEFDESVCIEVVEVRYRIVKKDRGETRPILSQSSSHEDAKHQDLLL
jgi:hypothetical protein